MIFISLQKFNILLEFNVAIIGISQGDVIDQTHGISIKYLREKKLNFN